MIVRITCILVILGLFNVINIQADTSDKMDTIRIQRREKKLREIAARQAEKLSETDHHGSTPLMIAGRKFPIDFEGGQFTIHGVPIFVKQVFNSGLGTGLTIWDGSIVLAKFLEHQFSAGLTHLDVVELGSGTGVVGLAAAALGAETTYLTDLPYVIENLQANIQRNKRYLPGNVWAKSLDWIDPKAIMPEADIILAADVVWVEELIIPFVKTLVRICTTGLKAGKGIERQKEQQEIMINEGASFSALEQSSTTSVSGRGPLVILSHQTRSKISDEILFTALNEHFMIMKVDSSLLHPKFRDDALSIYEMKLK